MTFTEFMTETRTRFKDELNSFLGDKGLAPVHFIPSLIGVDKKPLTVAVFPTATTGSTLNQQGESNMVHFSVQMFCNQNANEKGLAQGEEYYSALLEFIQSRTFGDYSMLEESVLCRMDEGEVVNGSIFLIGSRISSNTDYGWD